MNNRNGFSIRYLWVNAALLSLFSLILFYFILSACLVNPAEISSVYQGLGVVESTGLHRSIVLCLQFDIHAADAANRSGVSITLFFLVQIIIRLLTVVFYRRTTIRFMYADIAFSGLVFLAAFRHFIFVMFV
jgi:hypothetical protein